MATERNVTPLWSSVSSSSTGVPTNVQVSEEMSDDFEKALTVKTEHNEIEAYDIPFDTRTLEKVIY